MVSSAVWVGRPVGPGHRVVTVARPGFAVREIVACPAYSGVEAIITGCSTIPVLVSLAGSVNTLEVANSTVLGVLQLCSFTSILPPGATAVGITSTRDVQGPLAAMERSAPDAVTPPPAIGTRLAIAAAITQGQLPATTRSGPDGQLSDAEGDLAVDLEYVGSHSPSDLLGHAGTGTQGSSPNHQQSPELSANDSGDGRHYVP
jgi:hypothetical protein